jgi:hypothetical protein
MSDAAETGTPGEQEWKEDQGIGTETPADSDPKQAAKPDEDNNPEGAIGDPITDGDE